MPVSPAPPASPALVGQLRALCALLLAEGGPLIPRLALTAEERRALGGHVFAEAPSLVECVIDALESPGADFGHLPVQAAALRRQQDEASAWKLLAGALGALAQLAADNHLVEQAGAAQVARLVALSVEEEAARLGEHERLPHLLRRRALGAALAILGSRQRRIDRRTRQRQKLAAAADPPPPRAAGRRRRRRADERSRGTAVARLRDLAAAGPDEER